jgi:hypothetical protein
MSDGRAARACKPLLPDGRINPGSQRVLLVRSADGKGRQGAMVQPKSATLVPFHGEAQRIYSLTPATGAIQIHRRPGLCMRRRSQTQREEFDNGRRFFRHQDPR